MVQPLGDTRPAWKVLRVLANMLELPGFEFESSQDVLQSISGLTFGSTVRVVPDRLSNDTNASINPGAHAGAPAVASIYQLDGIVRRAPALQSTADAKSVMTQEVTA